MWLGLNIIAEHLDEMTLTMLEGSVTVTLVNIRVKAGFEYNNSENQNSTEIHSQIHITGNQFIWCHLLSTIGD